MSPEIVDIIARAEAERRAASEAQRARTAAIPFWKRDYYTAEEAAAEQAGHAAGHAFRLAEVAYNARARDKMRCPHTVQAACPHLAQDDRKRIRAIADGLNHQAFGAAWEGYNAGLVFARRERVMERNRASMRHVVLEHGVVVRDATPDEIHAWYRRQTHPQWRLGHTCFNSAVRLADGTFVDTVSTLPPIDSTPMRFR